MIYWKVFCPEVRRIISEIVIKIGSYLKKLKYSSKIKVENWKEKKRS